MPYTNPVHTDGPNHTIFAADVNAPTQYLAWLAKGAYTAAEYGAKGDGATDDSTPLANADAGAGTSGQATLAPTVNGNRVGANLTLGAGWRVPAGAKFAIDAGRTLTLTGPLELPLAQCFTGAGTVAFGPGAVRDLLAQWWGAKCDVQFVSGVTATSGSATVSAAPGTWKPGDVGKLACILATSQQTVSGVTYSRVDALVANAVVISAVSGDGSTLTLASNALASTTAGHCYWGTDDTAAWAAAITAAKASQLPIRIISVKLGSLINGNLPPLDDGVSLVGPFTAPPRGYWGTSNAARTLGFCFFVTANSGQSDPNLAFLTLRNGASAAGFVAYYPCQTMTNPPQVYPPTFNLQAGTDNQALRNVLVVNPFILVTATNMALPTIGTIGGSGSALAAGTYGVAYTAVIDGIESRISPAQPVTITAGQQIPVTGPALPPGGTTRNLYFTAAPAGVNVGLIVSGLIGPAYTITSPPAVNGSWPIGSTGPSRFTLEHVYGQPLYLGALIDSVYDTPKITHCHFWPFWKPWNTGDALETWLLNNCVAWDVLRCDGFQAHDLVTYGHLAALKIDGGTSGVGSGAITAGWFDGAKFPVWITNPAGTPGGGNDGWDLTDCKAYARFDPSGSGQRAIKFDGCVQPVTVRVTGGKYYSAGGYVVEAVSTSAGSLRGRSAYWQPGTSIVRAASSATDLDLEGTFAGSPTYHLDDSALAAGTTNAVRLAGRLQTATFSRNPNGSPKAIDLKGLVGGSANGAAILGVGLTSVPVTHGLAGAPAHVKVTPATDPQQRYWVSAYGATTFVVNVAAAVVGSAVVFDWYAQLGDL